MFSAAGCRSSYAFYVDRGQNVRKKLFLLDSTFQGVRNEKALDLARAGKWEEALAVWEEMENHKLAIDCGLFSNAALARYMTGRPALNAMERAVRICPDDEEIRNNFRVLSTLQ